LTRKNETLEVYCQIQSPLFGITESVCELTELVSNSLSSAESSNEKIALRVELLLGLKKVKEDFGDSGGSSATG
jgi:hypothetical protein